MELGIPIQRFDWVLESFCASDDETYYSRYFVAAGCNWRLKAYINEDEYLAVYLELAPGSSPPGWRRQVRVTLTLVHNRWFESNKVQGEWCFHAESNSWGFCKFLPLHKLDQYGGFLENNRRLRIFAQLQVLPPMNINTCLSCKEGNQASDASVSKSQGPSSCQVAQETENAADDDDDDDASEEGTDDSDDDDDASEEGTDDDDSSSEEGSDDSDSDSDDDDDDEEDDVISLVSDDGGWDISPLNQSNALENASHTTEQKRNSEAAKTEVSNGESDGAPKEDVDDIYSKEYVSRRLFENVRSALEQVRSLGEDASQTVENGENGDMGFNTVASGTETSNSVLEEIQPVKETMDVNGFEVCSSQVESVSLIFERHPDIAVDFRAKNQRLRKVCMSFLLGLIETLCESLEELSDEDLVEADIALTYLKDAGFKVDWLDEKLDQLKENKVKERSGLSRLQEIEEDLLKLKQKCSDLNALAEKEKSELSATRTAMSLDYIV